MRILRNLIIAGIVAVAAAWLPQAANAATGFATGNVNLRSGPGTQFHKIVVIPAGAPVEVYGCSSWCNVNYRGYVGWASAKYISPGGYYRPPYPQYRPPPPLFGFSTRPWWDYRYGAWYDGRRWYHDGRWYDRPTFSLYFRFGG